MKYALVSIWEESYACVTELRFPLWSVSLPWMLDFTFMDPKQHKESVLLTTLQFRKYSLKLQAVLSKKHGVTGPYLWHNIHVMDSRSFDRGTGRRFFISSREILLWFLRKTGGFSPAEQMGSSSLPYMKFCISWQGPPHFSHLALTHCNIFNKSLKQQHILPSCIGWLLTEEYCIKLST